MLHIHNRGCGFIPGLGTKILDIVWHSQKGNIYIYIVCVYIKRKAEEEIILRERFENIMLLALKLEETSTN